ncbi:hypothetical protein [Hansschlegelia beijingensis]|uniref:Uncharacterized protein n=1 Tax=Hansschlegelia beijingensis TaxID=1133344 RepID=A0A7W6D404_9HYPH|nr:hypothetical protein [Hansschlegelia beijingensis]MBB3972763.1 hypothetical protein [Hansschlegelia beijingensis]
MNVRRPLSRPNTLFGRQLLDDHDARLAGGRSHYDWRLGGLPNDMVPHSPFSDDIPAAANDNDFDEEIAA